MSPMLAFWESPPQLILVAFIALLLFGKRLPELMRSLGKGITEFKKGMNGIEEELNRGGGNNSNYNNNPNYNSNNYLPPPTYHESGRPLPTEKAPGDHGSEVSAAHRCPDSAGDPHQLAHESDAPDGEWFAAYRGARFAAHRCHRRTGRLAAADLLLRPRPRFVPGAFSDVIGVCAP